MGAAILQTRPAPRGRRAPTVHRQQHDGPDHSDSVRYHRGPRHRRRTCRRTATSVWTDDPHDHHPRGRAIRLPDVDGAFRPELGLPPRLRRIREAARARLHVLQPHTHRRHHEPPDLRHRRDPPLPELGELSDRRLRGHVRGRPVRDVRHRLATRARPGLRHAVHFCAHARPVHARPPAVLRHPQLAGLPQLHGRREHRGQPCGQGIRARTVRDRKVRRAQRRLHAAQHGPGLQLAQVHALAGRPRLLAAAHHARPRRLSGHQGLHDPRQSGEFQLLPVDDRRPGAPVRLAHQRLAAIQRQLHQDS